MPTLLQQDARALAFAHIAALLSAVLLVACEGPPARSKPWRHANESPAEVERPDVLVQAEAEELAVRRRRADTLRVHMRADPRHLNPLVSPTVWTTRIVHDTVFETLIRYEPPPDGSGPGRYTPGLATQWKVSPGGREIRLELRDGVNFHDGRALSSVDVQFSIDTARHPRTDAPYLRELLSDVSGVYITGPRSVRVSLTRPNAYVLRALALVPILPEAVYERRSRGRKGEPVVGTGPYRLDAWTDGVVALVRNPDYWGEAPAIGRIEFAYEPDAARALTIAKRGELDIIPALIPAHYPEQASAPAIEASFAPLRLRPPTLRYLALGQKSPPLSDVRVREAIALLVNRKELVEQRYHGLALPAPGPIWPGGPGDARSPDAPPFDPGAAAALLDAAGWADTDGDGARETEHARLQLSMLLLSDDDNAAERERLRKALTRAGFFVSDRRGTQAVLLNRMRADDFDLAFVEWSAAVDTDLSPLLETRGSRNFGGFSDPEIDALLARLRSAWTPAERAPLMAQLAKRVRTAMPLVPLVRPHPYGLVHRRVRGVRVYNGWIALRNLSLAHEDE